jgi:ketosteroid isomerase-like protein
MSRENVEIVRSIYEAFNRGDWDAAFRDQRPDIELTTPPTGPNAGTYRGREECQGFWEDMLMAFEAASAEPEELFESGDQVAVVLTIRARPKGSSAAIEIRNGHLWAFRDRTAQSVRIFPEPQKALEAAGLR